jgi:putative FmdB family regulatory protein
MPIYEYECTQCKQTFEILQKFNDSPLEKCIHCHGGPVKKLISASAFVLKGAGFYVNDYPSASRKKGVESEKNGSSEKKSESPPESKSEKAEKAAA